MEGPTQLDDRIPVEVGGIQVNFCKNPQCQNFGIPASTKRKPRGRGSEQRVLPVRLRSGKKHDRGVACGGSVYPGDNVKYLSLF